MEQVGKAMLFRSPRTDLIKKVMTSSSPAFKRHFNQSEEFFIRLSNELHIPRFHIHHDVRIKVPSPSYLEKLESVIQQVSILCPSLLEGLSYVFDPTEALKPTFFSLFKVDTQHYVYLLRIDLSPRHNYITITNPGTNDETSAYTSSVLFLESEMIPISEIQKVPEGFLVTPKQSISETWIGETGRGYFVQGIWLDRDLNKFFSKMFTPKGKKIYPWFPFNCRFRAVCASVVDIGVSGRKQTLAHLHFARTYIEENMTQIEAALHKSEFSEDSDTFQTLRAMVGSNSLSSYLEKVEVKAYLNTEDMKEYELCLCPE